MKIERNVDPGKAALGDIAHGTVVRVPPVNGVNPDPVTGLIVKEDSSSGYKTVVDLASGRLFRFSYTVKVRVYPDAVVCLNQEGR